MNPQATINYEEIIKRFENSEFWKLLDLKFEYVKDGEAAIRADFRKEYLNVKGTVHGGLILTILDIVMGAVGYSKGYSVLTLQLETRFLKPIVDGAAHAHGFIKHHGNNTIIIEGTVKDDQNELVALSTGTFRIVGAVPKEKIS